MSTPKIINDYEDLPCKQWLSEEYDDCPIEEGKWREGEERVCLKCGWKILFDAMHNNENEKAVPMAPDEWSDWLVMPSEEAQFEDVTDQKKQLKSGE